MKFVLSFASTLSALSLTTLPAMAQSFFWWHPTPVVPTRPTPASVPEIDASTSLLAVAAIAAAMLFVWERNRRRA